MSAAQRYTILVVVLMICLTVVYLNFQHTTGCSSPGDEDVKMYLEALNKRLLKAESEVQAKIIRLEKLELRELQEAAIGEAVKVTLRLSEQPLPAMPEYDLGTAFKNAEELADAIDDIFERVSKKSAAEGAEGAGDALDYGFGAGAEGGTEKKPEISDKEATRKCIEWKEKYSVVIGVSWGTAPMEVQEQWIALSCDYHLVGGASAEEQEEEYFELANELVDGNNEEPGINDILEGK